MGLRLRRGGLGQIRLRPIPKGSTAGRYDNPLNRRDIFANQGLKNRGMFAVHRQNCRPVTPGFRHQNGARSHERFFIGQGQGCALLHRF